MNPTPPCRRRPGSDNPKAAIGRSPGELNDPRLRVRNPPFRDNRSRTGLGKQALLRHQACSSFLTCLREGVVAQNAVAASMSRAANTPSGAACENSRWRRTVTTAAAMMIAPSAIPTPRPAGRAISAALTISKLAERPATSGSIRMTRWHPSATLLRERRNFRGSQPINRPVHDPRDVDVAVAEWEGREGENRRDRPMHRGP